MALAKAGRATNKPKAETAGENDRRRQMNETNQRGEFAHCLIGEGKLIFDDVAVDRQDAEFDQVTAGRQRIQHGEELLGVTVVDALLMVSIELPSAALTVNDE